MEWEELRQGILNDTLPRNRKKYVKFSNLASINQKMVLYYLKRGRINPDKRQKCLTGILEEMRRSSNERYDIEDTTKPE